MTLPTACPKPKKVVKVRKPLRATLAQVQAWQAKPRKPLPRATKPIARGAPPKKRNERAIARRYAAYQKVLRSDFHKRIRYERYVISGGFCECGQCVEVRRYPEQWDAHARELAFTEIPVWFTKHGKEPWQRFRSKDGSADHLSYKFFGEENPAEIDHIRFCWNECHGRREAQYGTRRAFLRGKRGGD